MTGGVFDTKRFTTAATSSVTPRIAHNVRRHDGDRGMLVVDPANGKTVQAHSRAPDATLRFPRRHVIPTTGR